ncbi:MAG: tetratricopeptide repeat protein [Phycisphaerae bacterium]|nr:tetratricopeptide repeat protein [Phycisphaerae bacterium]MDD5380781.1 tetratricopeptide repeat protein [Phycisphaerae bacterium]
MSKKNRSITLVFVVLLASAAIGLLLSAAVAKVSADTSARVEQAKSNIISFIKDGNYIEAQSQTQKLLADFPANSALPETLYDIAENFRWYGSSDRDKDKYERAGKVYRQIITNYPDSPFASKAQLGIAKTKVLSLVVVQDFNSADLALNEMVAAFQNHPNLADELYWIGRAFGYWERHEEEKDAYQRIIQNYPDNQYADRAQLGFAKANVQSLIMSKDYDGAEEALDKMVADFPEHPDLPESLYWIAERYAWADRYGEAERIHQEIIEDFPDSSFADKARLGFSKAEVLSLISRKEYEKGEKAFDKLFTDFEGHPDLPRAVLAIGEQCSKQGLSKENEDLAQAEALFDMSDKAIGRLIADFPKYPDLPESLYWIAERYNWEGRFNDSKSLYQQIIQNYPDSPFSSKAKTGLSKANALSLVLSQDQVQASEALEKIVDDFNDNPNLLKDVLKRALKARYKLACSRQQKEGTNEQVKEGFRNAKSIAEMIEKTFPDSAADLPEAHLYIAYCDYQLGENAKAAESCQKMISDWPDYEYIHYAQILIAGSYEKLAESGVVPTSEADYQIEQALLSVIEKETKIDRESIARALLGLGRWYVKMGEKDLAASFYEEFIMRMDDPNNPDALAAKAELEKLR